MHEHKKAAPAVDGNGSGIYSAGASDFTTTDIVGQFRDAIAAAGLTPPEHIDADGALHRFSTNGKSGDDAGWYVLHMNGIAAGEFGDWRSDVRERWRVDIGRKFNADEVKALRVKADAARRQREAAERANHERTAKSATARWDAAAPATTEHPYLQRKGVEPHGTRTSADGRLLVPMYADGKLWNLERIAPEPPADGSASKKGLFQGRRKGCSFTIGNPVGARVLCLCEGLATGASIHQATALPVTVALNADNLQPVAKALRAAYPKTTIIICADDDIGTNGNPGRSKADAAAKAVGALVVLPDFGHDRPDGATDFNDLHQARGLDVVKQAIGQVIEAAGIDADDDQDEAAVQTEPLLSRPELEPDEDPTDSGLFPPQGERPKYVVLDDWAEEAKRKYRPGVYHCTVDEKGDMPALVNTWFCSPLYVEAITFDGQDNNFGRLLRFRNPLKRWREWAMPMELLRGSGDELRGELLSMGVELDPYQGKRYLADYLQRAHPKRRMHCAMQTGWAGKSFVLPDGVIGPTAAGVIFQSGERGHDEHTTAGTSDGWRSEIAARAAGNPLLVLALSAGFAGPMLARTNTEGGGLHFVGDSSTGKTTAIEAACSVWGGPNYRRSWRATANGMEGAAALFNDCLLALDEISECDPREIGAIVYALGNGRGKQRASRSGAARGVVRWRCTILSSGERTIDTAMREGGKRAKAGQSVRLLDIPVARRFGAWDELHGAASAAAFSDAIKRAAATHHGHVGRAFLEKLTRDDRDFCAMLEQHKAPDGPMATGADGQDKRAAARFALFAMAGELATEYGLTGWTEGTAVHAALEGLGLWRSLRGSGNDERRQIAELVSSFIERHGDSRFSDADGDHDHDRTRDRAGWWRDSADGRHFLFNADGMREALSGHDFRRALDVLQEIGALLPGNDGKRQRNHKVGGRQVKLYCVLADKLAEAHV